MCGPSIHIGFYCTVPVILRLAVGSVIIVHDVCPPVIIEEQRRVYALHLRQHYRIGPLPERIRGLDEEIARPDIGGDHVEHPVVRVELDVRGEYAATDVLAVEIDQLRRP